MNKWNQYRMGEVCSAIYSGGTPSTSNDEYWDGPYYWLSSGETSNRYITKTEKTITKKGIDNSSTRLAKSGTLVMACAGQGKTRGQSSILKCDTYINQSIIAMVGKPELLDTTFLFYNMLLRYDELRMRSDSSSIRGSITTDMLKQLPISIPDLSTQKRIANILSAYDNLIENNNLRLELLERVAQLLYIEWFVRFRFPGHETAEFENGLPKGWKYKRTEEAIVFNPVLKTGNQSVFTIIPMEALSTISMVLDSSCFVVQDSISGRRSQNGDTLFAKITPCLENGKTGFVIGMPDDEVLGGSTEFIVMRSKTLTPHYVYCIARSHYFRQTAILSMNGADGRQRVDEDKLKSTKILQPEKSVLDRFEAIVTPVFDAVYQLVQKNKNLIKQRDLLLPRLMSGKLEV